MNTTDTDVSGRVCLVRQSESYGVLHLNFLTKRLKHDLPILLFKTYINFYDCQRDKSWLAKFPALQTTVCANTLQMNRLRIRNQFTFSDICYRFISTKNPVLNRLLAHEAAIT